MALAAILTAGVLLVSGRAMNADGVELASQPQPKLATTVSLSNTKLPLDQHGNEIITGEAGCLEHNGTFYFYFNDWGTVRSSVRTPIRLASAH